MAIAIASAARGMSLSEDKMSNAVVSVYQIRSLSEHSFLNVGDEMGRVEVSGVVYEHPTILCRNGIHFMLMQFDSEAWMKEWLDENAHKWDVQILDEARKIEVSE